MGRLEYHGGAEIRYYEGGVFLRGGFASDTGRFYLLRDHLGSSSVIADSVEALNGRNYYYPYGDNRGGAQNALTTKRFSGQYHEAGIGLYDYKAR